MTVPSRTEAASLLLSLDPPAWHLRHSRAVAEVAAFLAMRATARGVAVDRRLVDSAALLHDVDKALPRATEGGEGHGERGARWVSRVGHPELADAVRSHPVGRLVERGWDRLIDPDPSIAPEVRIVAYADKRAGQRLESLDDRFASWARRYPPGRGAWDPATADLARTRAARLEAVVCSWCGIVPGQVERLAWTGRAIRIARLDIEARPERKVAG